MSGFGLRRLKILMEPEPGNPLEVEGALNPAAIRGPDGGGGCEDPRVTFVQPLERYIMTYTAFSARGPRIALAVSRVLLRWQRLGLATFAPYRAVQFDDIDNKDASLFPVAIPNPSGAPQLAILHRPLFPGTRPEETACQAAPREVDLDRESIWISYCSMASDVGGPEGLGRFTSHHRLATPVAPWEQLKIGGGTPPMMTRHGWLVVYHGVSALPGPSLGGSHLLYSAGVMVLSKEHPRVIRYRSREPVLTPQLPNERRGTVSNVVFPSGRRSGTGVRA